MPVTISEEPTADEEEVAGASSKNNIEVANEHDRNPSVVGKVGEESAALIKASLVI